MKKSDVEIGQTLYQHVGWYYTIPGGVKKWEVVQTASGRMPSCHVFVKDEHGVVNSVSTEELFPTAMAALVHSKSKVLHHLAELEKCIAEHMANQHATT